MMDYQLERMCRICLKEGEDLRSIFFIEESHRNEVSLPNKIMACSTVEVVMGDGLPELICPKCLMQVDVAYEFREKCQSADATLRKYISLVGPFLTNSLLTNEPVLKEHGATIQTYEVNVKSSDSIYDFMKEDSISIEDSKPDLDNEAESDNPLSQQQNHCESDIPLSEQQNHCKKKKEYKSRKQRKTKVYTSEEGGNGSDSDKKRKPNDEKDVKCPICKKTFAYLCILKDHMVQHTGARPYLCSACGKSFGHTASLTNHMKTHYSDKPHKCDQCDLGFHRRAHLVLHMRTHTGEKPFVCDVCGRKFAQGTYLKEHMRVHSGEKPFICDICGHGFSRKSCLVMHRRVHTGELPFPCPECGRAFSQRSQRKRHVMRNHRGSACLRETGELILKDLDLKNRNAIQEEVLSDNSGMMQRDAVAVTLQRQVAVPVNNQHFVYQQDSTSSLSPTTMPLPLIQIHRTLLQ